MQTAGAAWYLPSMDTTSLTTDTIAKRLRWVMLCVILFDFLNTCLGQPGTYWSHPETAVEGNSLFRFFMVLGPVAFLAFEAAYIAAALLVASMSCRRGALVGIMAYIFGHFYGASTWLGNRWHLGAIGFIAYGVVLAAVIVGIAFPSAAGTGCRASAAP